MEVLMTSGAYAGEIRDIKPFYARQMIQDGRALDPNAPLAESPVAAAPVLIFEDKPRRGKKAAAHEPDPRHATGG